VIKTWTDTSPAAASTVVSPAMGLGGLSLLDSFLLVATLQGATGGTLDIYLQTADEDATTPVWIDYAHFAQLPAGAAQTKMAFTVSRYAQSLSGTVVGSGSTPALAQSTMLGGEFGEKFRVVFVAGAGTSAGAVQTISLIGSKVTRRV
jgi:hypothetical protein